ncbi:hypothetical protein ZTR_11424, partial [Talaromyces verruculosus]
MGHLSEYFLRTAEAKPELLGVTRQLDKVGQKLARLAREIDGTDIYFSIAITDRSSKSQHIVDLPHSHHDPHIPKPDHTPDTSCIDPALLQKQNEPLSEDPPSNGLDDRLERSPMGDLGQNWSNKSLPSTDTMCNMADSSNPDTTSSNVRGIAAISPPTSIERANCSPPETYKVATRVNMQASVEDVSDEGDDIILQSGRASPTGCDENMQPNYVNDEGENIVPQKKRVRPSGDGENMQAS